MGADELKRRRFVRLQSVGLLVGPQRPVGRHPVLVEVLACAGGRVDLDALLRELVAGEQQVGLLNGVTGGYQHRVLGNPVADRQHGLEQGLVEVVAYAAHPTAWP